ncbi:MAG: ArnT family glycosyltransferase [Acidimicrobiia bacterium]
MRRSPNALVTTAAVVAAVLVLLAARHGAALTRDSITYLATGRNLLDHQRLTDFTGRPLTAFPPLYPLLAAGSATTARAINALATAATVVLTAALAARFVRHRTVLAATIALVAVSPVLIDLGRHVWSEPVFVALAMAVLLGLDRDEPLVAGVLTGLAFLARYAGLVLLPVGLIVFVLRRRYRDAVVFAATGAVAVVGWVVRNAIATDSTRDLLGPRLHTESTLAHTARRLAGGLKALVLPASTPASVTAAVGAIALAAIVAALYVYRHARPAERPLVPLTFAVLYVVFVAVSAYAAGADLDARTLGPVWPVAVVLLAWVVDRALPYARLRTPVAAVAVLAAVLTAAWAVTVAFERDAGERRAHRYPPQYDGLFAALAALPRDAAVVSDDPWGVYERTRYQPIDFALVPVRAGLSIVPLSDDRLADLACRRPTYAVVTDPRTVIPPALEPTDETRVGGAVVVALRARTCPTPRS